MPSLRTSTPDARPDRSDARARRARAGSGRRPRFAVFGPSAADFGATLRKPSVSLTQNERSTEDCCAWSSVALTTQRQRPERLLRLPLRARAARPRDLVDPRSARAGEAVRRSSRSGSIRFAVTVEGRTSLNESVWRLGHPVAVRRDHGERRRRRVHAGVHDGEHLLDRALAARVGRPVQQLAVERHRRRAAGVERRAGDGAEPDERLGELEVRQADAVAAAGARRRRPARSARPCAGRRRCAGRAGRAATEGSPRPRCRPALPFRTITGPPPSASAIPADGQSGVRTSWMRSGVPGVASAASFGACVPTRRGAPRRSAGSACRRRSPARSRSRRARRRSSPAGTASSTASVDAGTTGRLRTPGRREERRCRRRVGVWFTGQRPPAAEPLPVAVERDPRDVQRSGRRDADARARPVWAGS